MPMLERAALAGDAARRTSDTAMTRSQTPLLDTSQMTITRTRDGYFRFVSHELRILTTGFALRDGLVRNAKCILNTNAARAAMEARYAEEYGHA